MATTHSFTLDQGSAFQLDFVVKNSDNSLKSLVGYTARMQFRTSYASTVVRLDASTSDSRLVINTANSVCSIVLSAIDTAALSAGVYVYDIEIVDSAGRPTRIVQGYVTVDPEVTRIP